MAVEILTDGVADLTPDEYTRATQEATRLGATFMSLYRTSEGLRAYVKGPAGEDHLGVKI